MALLTYDDQAVRRDLPVLVATMLATGLRLGEACALLWRSVDLDTGALEVEATVVRITGQGLLRKSTKTTAGHRTLRLPRWGVEMLRERAAASAANTDTPLFPSPLGNLRDASNTAADLRDAFENAGFGWATSHVLRKTTASVLDSAGMSAREIADQLGHARPSITMDRYMGRKIASDRGAVVLESLAGR
jgi:integrase